MEKAETIRSEQVGIILQDNDAELFREYMEHEALKLKSAAGAKLIIEGLRRWKRSRQTEQATA